MSQTTIDRAQPYLIRLPARQSAGELHIGWRSYPVTVLDISWQAITVALPSSAIRRVKLHSKAIVWHQGNQYPAVVSKPCQKENGVATLSLMISDTDDPRLKKIQRAMRRGDATCGEQRLNADPVVVAVALIGCLVAFLVMPGWGESLGTSTTVTEAITGLLTELADFFTGLF